MKLFGTALSLITIALNTVLASSAGVLLCKHETGDSHLLSKAVHESESHLNSCHSSGGVSNVEHKSGESCSSCTDSEVKSQSSLDKASPRAERTVVKCPSVATYIVPDVAVAIPCLRQIAETLPARAPPVSFAATEQYASTVQLLL